MNTSEIEKLKAENKALRKELNACNAYVDRLNMTLDEQYEWVWEVDAITQNEDYFHDNAGQLFDFVNAFMNDLIFWKTKIFYEGAPSVGFLNDSITTNANMLNALLQPDSEQDENLEDIFDF